MDGGRGETRELGEIPLKELDVLSRFILSVKKTRTAGQFEPSTLSALLPIIKQHQFD